MGLDIIAYNNAIFRGGKLTDEYEDLYDENKIFVKNIYDEFPHAFEGLREGIYDVDNSDIHKFRAGSYGGYNDFRRILADFAGYVDEECWDNPEIYNSQPFYELVNFSDCEGFIGPVASENLYQDFVDHREEFYRQCDEKADKYTTYIQHKYKDWLTAFQLAKNNGFVMFG